MYKCPVCNSQTEHKSYCDECESYEKCLKCGYYDEYAYGHGRTCIGGIEIFGSYLDTESKIRKDSKILNKLIIKQRKFLIRLGYKKTWKNKNNILKKG